MAETELRKLSKRQQHHTPPFGWEYITQEGHAIRAQSLSELTRVTARYLQMNHRDVPDNLSELIEDQICNRLPKWWCSGKPARVVISKAMIMSGFNLMVNLWKARGRVRVPQAEAERRAEICATCPENRDHAMCIPCHGLYSIVYAFFRNCRTTLDQHLRICGVCGCINAAQVHVTGDLLAKLNERDPHTYPPVCWKPGVMNAEGSEHGNDEDPS